MPDATTLALSVAERWAARNAELDIVTEIHRRAELAMTAGQTAAAEALLELGQWLLDRGRSPADDEAADARE